MVPSVEVTPNEPSKPNDFVAHLRLINFTLLVASIGLIIAANQPTDSQYEDALADLKQMTGIANDSVAGLMRDQAEQLSIAASGARVGERKTLYVPVFNRRLPVVARFSPDLRYLFPHTIRAKIAGLRQKGEPEIKGESPTLLPDGRERIETLQDFRTLWDLFSGPPVSLLLPDQIVSAAKVSADLNEDPTKSIWTSARVFVERPTQVTLATWDLTTAQARKEVVQPPEHALWSAATDPNVSTIYVAASGQSAPSNTPANLESCIEARSLPSLAVSNRGIIPRSMGPIALAVSPNGKLLATHQYYSISLWNLPDITVRDSIPVLKDDWRRPVLCFSPNSDQLLFTSEDDPIRPPVLRLVSANDLKPIEGFDSLNDDYLAVAFAPNGESLATATFSWSTWQTDITLIDAHTGKKIGILGNHKTLVTSLVFLPDGTAVVSASNDGSVRLWPTQSSGKPKELVGTGCPLERLTFSPNAELLAAGGYDLRIHLWDMTEKAPPRVLEQEGVAQSLSFSGDGNRLACAGFSLPEVDVAPVWLDDELDGSTVTLRAESPIFPFGYSETFGRTRVAIEVPLRARSIDFDLRDLLARRARETRGSLWLKLPFDRAFPSLTALTKSLQSSKLDDLLAHLEEEKKRTGEKFEIMGLKIPAAALNRFGFAVLLGLQLYFWIHLRAFSAKNVSAMDVSLQPWIGLYPDWIARVCYSISAVIIPVVSSLVLLTMAWPLGSNWERLANCTCVLVSTILASLLSLNIISIWRSADAPPGRGGDATPAQVAAGQPPAHEAIALVAHRMWLEQGCPNNCAEEHWLAAINEVRQANARRQS